MWSSGSSTPKRVSTAGTTKIGPATPTSADCFRPPDCVHESSTSPAIRWPRRWERTTARGHGPDLITADKLAGLIRELETKGKLIHVQSERLSWMTEVASCDDFAGRWRFLVANSPHRAAAEKALLELLRPGPETMFPGPVLPSSEGRNEAITVARQAAVAFVSGDPAGMKKVASAASPQLSRCSAPEDFRSGWRADAGAVDIRGNANVAFAKVEIRYRGKNFIGADPFLVILRSESAGWKAFVVTNDVACMKELPALCRVTLQPRRNGPPPPVLACHHRPMAA